MLPLCLSTKQNASCTSEHVSLPQLSFTSSLTHRDVSCALRDHLRRSVHVYSRPEGAPALCDDPGELCQPPGVHLEPLQRVVSPCTPRPVIEVIFIEAGLQARKRAHGSGGGGVEGGLDSRWMLTDTHA